MTVIATAQTRVTVAGGPRRRVPTPSTRSATSGSSGGDSTVLHHRGRRVGAVRPWRYAERLFDWTTSRLHPAGVELASPSRPAAQDRVTLMEIPALAISSTDCRLRVGEREPIWYLVPDGIVQYIAKRGLYHN